MLQTDYMAGFWAFLAVLVLIPTVWLSARFLFWSRWYKDREERRRGPAETTERPLERAPSQAEHERPSKAA